MNPPARSCAASLPACHLRAKRVCRTAWGGLIGCAALCLSLSTPSFRLVPLRNSLSWSIRVHPTRRAPRPGLCASRDQWVCRTGWTGWTGRTGRTGRGSVHVRYCQGFRCVRIGVRMRRVCLHAPSHLETKPSHALQRQEGAGAPAARVRARREHHKVPPRARKMVFTSLGRTCLGVAWAGLGSLGRGAAGTCGRCEPVGLPVRLTGLVLAHRAIEHGRDRCPPL